MSQWSTNCLPLVLRAVPKNVAIARPEPRSGAVGPIDDRLPTALRWLIKIFDPAPNLRLKMLRTEPVHEMEHSATVRDLEHIVADMRDPLLVPTSMSLPDALQRLSSTRNQMACLPTSTPLWAY